jgi:hypothetical protein
MSIRDIRKSEFDADLGHHQDRRTLKGLQGHYILTWI